MDASLNLILIPSSLHVQEKSGLKFVWKIHIVQKWTCIEIEHAARDSQPLPQVIRSQQLTPLSTSTKHSVFEFEV